MPHAPRKTQKLKKRPKQLTETTKQKTKTQTNLSRRKKERKKERSKKKGPALLSFSSLIVFFRFGNDTSHSYPANPIQLSSAQLSSALVLSEVDTVHANAPTLFANNNESRCYARCVMWVGRYIYVPCLVWQSGLAWSSPARLASLRGPEYEAREIQLQGKAGVCTGSGCGRKRTKEKEEE